jgi:hypothetical protein
MSIRVCKNGHVTGYRHCGTCGADASGVLGGRRQPVPMHPKSNGLVALRVFRAAHRSGKGRYSKLPPASAFGGMSLTVGM